MPSTIFVCYRFAVTAFIICQDERGVENHRQCEMHERRIGEHIYTM